MHGARPPASQRLEIPRPRDDPINSRNSPTTLNVLTCSSDFEFSNRFVFIVLVKIESNFLTPPPFQVPSIEIPRPRDDPINSRNSPTTLNVLTCSSDFEFSNRFVFIVLVKIEGNFLTPPPPFQVPSIEIPRPHNDPINSRHHAQRADV